MEFPVLMGLDESAQRMVLAGPRRRYARNDTVFHMGDAAGSLHLLVSGHVSVSVETPTGDVSILTVLGPGAAFGELALLDENETRSATIRALDRVETIALSRDRFAQLRRTSPDLDHFIIGLLRGYVRRLEARLLEALFVPVEKRVLRQLVELCQTYGAGRSGTVIPLTQEIVAGMAGSTRPTTNQMLRTAEADGLISVGRGQIRIVDADRLAQRAG